MTFQDKYRIESMIRIIIIGTSGHPVNYCYLIIMNNYTVCMLSCNICLYYKHIINISKKYETVYFNDVLSITGFV